MIGPTRGLACEGVPVVELREELYRINAKGLRDLKELDHIQPPFATFDLGNERLRAGETGGKLGLRQVRSSSRLDEQLAKAVIFLGEDRSSHG
jgi:hypothetical protein